MQPGDLNPQRVSAERLNDLIQAAASQGINLQRAPEFDHDSALYVRRITNEER